MGDAQCDVVMNQYIFIIKVNFQEIMTSKSLQCPDIVTSFVILVDFLKCYFAEKNKFLCQLHYNQMYNHVILNFSHLLLFSSDTFANMFHLQKDRILTNSKILSYHTLKMQKDSIFHDY